VADINSEVVQALGKWHKKEYGVKCSCAWRGVGHAK